MYRYVISILSFILCSHLFIFGQTKRNDYQALFEIEGKIYHGAGQSFSDFEGYYNLMPQENKPSIYMSYIGLKEITSHTWSNQLKNELASFNNSFIIPQIGLSMTNDGQPSEHYEQDVANGVYDQQIQYLIEGLANLNRPVFLRIGYEFNGKVWNGYEASTYINAFQRVTDSIRAADIEVATVWCFAPGGDDDYMTYYPGDTYVDWWGIDIFSPSHFSDATTVSFMKDADLAQKPVMIGECTPRYVGADDNTDWIDWFSPYFNFIDDYPGVKATCYISWDWGAFEAWSDWGNSTIGINDSIQVVYTHHIRQADYITLETESAFRQLFSSDDITSPTTPQIISSSLVEGKPCLVWSSSKEKDIHYLVYKDNQLIRSTKDTSFCDISATVGSSYSLQITSIDLAGNESQKTSANQFTLPDTIVKNDNSEFNNLLASWSLPNYNGAEASVKTQNNTVVIAIEKSTNTNWHIQLSQPIEVTAGMKYYITVEGYSNSNAPFSFALQQNHTPYSMLTSKFTSLSTSSSVFSTSVVEASENDHVNIALFLGQYAAGDTVVINSIKLYEIANENKTTNSPPVAVVATTSLDVQTLPITLDGSASTDVEGNILSYEWTQLSGPDNVHFASSTSSAVIIDKMMNGEYIFQLKVMDNKGETSVQEVLVNTQIVTDTENITAHSWIIKNPVQSSLHVQVPYTPLQYHVISLNGRDTLIQGQINNFTLNIDVSSLTSNVYIIQISHPQYGISSFQFIKY